MDAGIQKKIHGSGATTLIISNKEMNDVMKILQALQNSNTLLKGITKSIENETKEYNRGFIGMLLDTLGASLLENMVPGKGMLRAGYVSKDIQSKEGKGMLTAGYESKDVRFKKKLTPPHPLTNLEIQKYYQNESRFNGVYSRDNLPKIINDSAYLININEYADIGTHWIDCMY